MAVKNPPKGGVLTSVFRRNYKADLSYGVDITIGRKRYPCSGRQAQ